MERILTSSLALGSVSGGLNEVRVITGFLVFTLLFLISLLQWFRVISRNLSLDRLGLLLRSRTAESKYWNYEEKT